MQLLIFALVSLALQVKTQTFLPIACQSDNTCTSVIDPSRDNICYKGICMCQNSTTHYYELCTMKDAILGFRSKARSKELRTSCTDNAECEHVEGATCVKTGGFGNWEKICDCLPHLVVSADGQKCLKKVTELWERCNETTQCAASLNAECDAEGRCRCGSNYHYVLKNNICTMNKAYGDSCTSDEESCYEKSIPYGTNTLSCSNGICNCSAYYRFENNKCQYSAGSRTIYQVYLVAGMLIGIGKIL